jgi:hypothetical protein
MMGASLTQSPQRSQPAPTSAAALRATHDAFVECVVREQAAGRAALSLGPTGPARLTGELAMAYRDAGRAFAEAYRYLGAGREGEARHVLTRVTNTDHWPAGAVIRAERVLGLLEG